MTNALKLATPVEPRPTPPPSLGANVARRWHTVVVEAPEHTNYSVEQDEDGLLRIAIHGQGEEVGAQRTIQCITVWSDKGTA